MARKDFGLAVFLSKVLWDPLADWYRSLVEAWTDFWFRPADPTLLGVIRILTGLMLVYTHIIWGMELEAFFGPHGWLSAEVVHAFQQNQYVFTYWWWVPADSLWLAHGVALVLLVLFTIGFLTRATSILAFLITVSYVHRVPGALFGLDQINAMLTLYLAIGPSGRALSVDRWLMRIWFTNQAGTSSVSESVANCRKCIGANLALRLIQVHMCVIYFFAGISKLQGPAWWNGEAMWRAFANLEYQSADMTWLADYPWLVNLMTHATVLWEVSFCFLVWRPLLRPLILIGGVVMHLGIGLCLGMWTFGLVMLIGCASFLPAEWFQNKRIHPGKVRQAGSSRISPAPALVGSSRR